MCRTKHEGSERRNESPAAYYCSHSATERAGKHQDFSRVITSAARRARIVWKSHGYNRVGSRGFQSLMGRAGSGSVGSGHLCPTTDPAREVRTALENCRTSALLLTTEPTTHLSEKPWCYPGWSKGVHQFGPEVPSDLNTSGRGIISRLGITCSGVRVTLQLATASYGFLHCTCGSDTPTRSFPQQPVGSCFSRPIPAVVVSLLCYEFPF